MNTQNETTRQTETVEVYIAPALEGAETWAQFEEASVQVNDDVVAAKVISPTKVILTVYLDEDGESQWPWAKPVLPRSLRQ